ncbi:MAG: hypothetical protein AAGN35_19615 [Bacteroidota bacterium]
MKAKHVYLALLALLFAFPSFAQNQDGSNVESLRIAYITTKLSLTSDEAKIFWPVYDEYQAETKALKKSLRTDLTDVRNNFDGMSDKDINAFMDRYMDSKQRELELTLKYHEEFKKVLPIRKVARLYKAEQEFTKMLLRRLQEQRRQNNGQNPNGQMMRRRRF